MNQALIITFLLFIICSCTNKDNHTQVFADSKSLIVDSFQVSKLKESIEILNFKEVNTKLITLIFDSGTIRIYNKLPAGSYLFEKSIRLKETNLAYSFFKYESDWLVIDVEGNLFRYDSLWAFMDKQAINLSLNILKNNNRLIQSNNLPFKINGDTVVGYTLHDDFSGYEESFSEQPYVRFRITKDSIILLNQLSHRPKSAIEYNALPSHCFRKNEIFTIYPCYDTIYRCDLKTGITKKTAIDNPDYRLPQPFVLDSLMNFGYVAQYQIKNFSYIPQILYNPVTDHFVVFYYKYLINQKSKDNLKEREIHLYAIVLDSNLKKISCIKFDRKYSNPESGFYYSGKGIALSVFKNKFDFETTTFHIFNF
jgi:hypothetical protein